MTVSAVRQRIAKVFVQLLSSQLKLQIFGAIYLLCKFMGKLGHLLWHMLADHHVAEEHVSIILYILWCIGTFFPLVYIYTSKCNPSLH